MNWKIALIPFFFAAVANAELDSEEELSIYLWGIPCHCNTTDELYEKDKEGRCFYRHCSSTNDDGGFSCNIYQGNWGIWNAIRVEDKHCLPGAAPPNGKPRVKLRTHSSVLDELRPKPSSAPPKPKARTKRSGKGKKASPVAKPK